MDFKDPRVLATGLGIAGAVVLGTSLALGSPSNPIREAAVSLQNPPPASGPMVTATADQRSRYAASREYQHVTAQPDGTRAIPFVQRAYTPIVANPQRTKVFRQGAAGVRAWLQEIKRALTAAGRGDEDARCVWCLWAIESGHGRSIWCGNVGNIKCHPYGSPDVITSANPVVWVRNPYASSVYVLVDRVQSFDSYYGFATLDDYCRYQKAFFETTSGDHGGQRYQGVLEGYRQGGLAGLAAAATALSRGGYSPEPAAVRVREQTYVWNLYKQYAGGDAAWEALK